MKRVIFVDENDNPIPGIEIFEVEDDKQVEERDLIKFFLRNQDTIRL